MSHLQLSRGRPRNSLNQPAPIEALVPADVRNMIYLQLAAGDQFKLNFYSELRRIFNPYDAYPININSLDFPISVCMYSEVKMFDKLFASLYNIYKYREGDLYSRLHDFNLFNALGSTKYSVRDTHLYYNCIDNTISAIFDYITKRPTSYMYNTVSADTCAIFIKFCLARINHDIDIFLADQRSAAASYISANSFWSEINYMEGYDNHITIYTLSYNLYTLIVGLISSGYANSELCYIFEKHFINSSSIYMRRVIYMSINNISETEYTALYLDDLLYRHDASDKANTIQKLHLPYIICPKVLLALAYEKIITRDELATRLAHIIKYEDSTIENLMGHKLDKGNVSEYFSYSSLRAELCRYHGRFVSIPIITEYLSKPLKPPAAPLAEDSDNE